MVSRVSMKRIDPRDLRDEFIARLAIAVDQGRVSDPALVERLLGRGRERHTPRRLSLHELDGDWS